MRHLKTAGVLNGLVLIIILFSLLFAVDFASARDIPPQLYQWKNWVLDTHRTIPCPAKYNDPVAARCAWPSRLNLDIGIQEGRFEQQWLVLASQWVPLPGDKNQWPEQVAVNGREVPVMNRDGVPMVMLEPGEQIVTGSFLWRRIPETLAISPEVGLVTLRIEGRKMDTLHMDKDGRLWLKKAPSAERLEDRFRVRIFRLLDDTVPFRVTQHLRLEVSGAPREIILKGLLIENAIPLSLESRLPVKFAPDGALVVQARPGQWEIQCESRMEGRVQRIGLKRAPFGNEIWSFRARHHLRMVEISGPPSIEPARTQMPDAWKSYPAYAVKPGASLVFKEIRRGDPEPAPDNLQIHRTWWLDFNGGGFTAHDKISGTINRSWSLKMNPPAVLGRVSVDGMDQLITSQGPGGKHGVELRKGALALSSDARYPARMLEMPAIGWDHDFQSASATLHLPPGWRLLTIGGVDEIPDTWFQQWTLLDFFLVLVISIAIARLYHFKWGIVSLLTMILIFQEPGAPRVVWIHLVAATALLKYLPQGWFRRLISLWRNIALVVLIVLALPFMTGQARWGLYPQLEPHGAWSFLGGMTLHKVQQYEDSAMEMVERDELRAPSKSRRKMAGSRSYGVMPEESLKSAIFTQDPDAVVQTGPGLPTWQWHRYSMKWNGPVDKNQKISLWLMSPLVNRLLAFSRVLLLALLIVIVVDIGRLGRRLKKGVLVFIPLFLLWPVALPQNVSAAEQTVAFPPAELLEELERRLIRPPECMPHCADISRMDITVDNDRLQLMLKIHAAVETAVPLPASHQSWSPDQAYVDQLPLNGLSRGPDGTLWAIIPEGIHHLTLTGWIGGRNEIQISLPLPPHQASFRGDGWTIRGLRENGRVEASLFLTREHPDQQIHETKGGKVLPPFFHVERIYHLGMQWQVSTTVTRISPSGSPVVAFVPVMEGESVNTPGIHVEKGSASIHMGPAMKSVSFTSSLPFFETLTLSAPEGVPWTESWVLEVSPIWHAELSGIPVIHHYDDRHNRRPEWRPWPGESVAINISKPKGIKGKVLTIDSVALDLTPGRRFDTALLMLDIRSSRGGQHPIELPESANLQDLSIDGKHLPINQNGRIITIPLRPGFQKVSMQWHQSRNSKIWLRGPQVKIGEPAVNATVRFNMPRDRWILFTGGPRLGPAVLFWSYCLIVVVVAIGLGRTSLTPLKTRHWLLLGLGLTQVHPLVAVMIVGWLLALGYRGAKTPTGKWFRFNVIQIGLGFWTLAALMGLYIAVQRGLLGIPDMQIAGNNATAFTLNWTLDRIDWALPRPWALAVPKWIFNVVMLFWALWLAFSLLGWLRWGWQCLCHGGMWKKSGYKWTGRGVSKRIETAQSDKSLKGAPDA